MTCFQQTDLKINFRRWSGILNHYDNLLIQKDDEKLCFYLIFLHTPCWKWFWHSMLELHNSEYDFWNQTKYLHSMKRHTHPICFKCLWLDFRSCIQNYFQHTVYTVQARRNIWVRLRHWSQLLISFFQSENLPKLIFLIRSELKFTWIRCLMPINECLPESRKYLREYFWLSKYI